MSILSGLKLLYSVVLQQINVDNQILSTTPLQLTVPLPTGTLGGGSVLVPNGAVDQVLPLQGAYYDFGLVFSDQEVSIKVQGVGSTPIPIRGTGVALLDSKNLTSLLVSNSSGYDARVQYTTAVSQVP